ncbi:hypothetical protein ACS5PN_12805 [Roseateles sp. NT4]|uniref:hypothetical protein n=1 Tax=Roseateles sp. NT4 TaxID=3453715 RepID=UPI003EEA4145
MSKSKFWMLALLLCALTGLARADVILRTGVDGSNVVQAEGSTDTHWQISTDNKATYADAKVLYAAQICCNMGTAGTTAAWISDPSVTAGSSATQWGTGTDVWIKTSFDLTGYNLSTVGLSGLWRIADWTFGVYLNNQLITGTDIGNCGGDQNACGTWFSDHVLTVATGSALFTSGINTLEFRGQSLNSAWDGLWFDGTVTGRQGNALPLPGTLPLLALGMLALRATRRRR